MGARLIGVELYFDDLAAAKRFYQETLGLHLSQEQSGHHVQFETGGPFLCLERKGVEDYPSRDKAVIFLEVADVRSAVERLGKENVVHFDAGNPHGGSPWAALHDPEGHNVLLLQANNR
jgi:predicted enzyme related to lactoylglutathione lyase